MLNIYLVEQDKLIVLVKLKKNNFFYITPEVSLRKGALKNFVNFSGKHFIKKETLVQVFSFEFFQISKNTFFTEHVWATTYRLLASPQRKWQ